MEKESGAGGAEAGRGRSREWMVVLGAIGLLILVWAASGLVAYWAPQPAPAPSGESTDLGGLAECGVENLAWSAPGRLLRGGAPPAEGLECLARNGVEVLIDLRSPAEDGLDAATLARAAGLQYANLGVPNDTAPSPEVLRTWMGVVTANLEAGRVVLVHDATGQGRVGFWDAVYAMRQGRPVAEAIEGAYLGKAYDFDGAVIGCEAGGNGQVQALAEIGASAAGEAYWPNEDEHGTVWADCPRPAYMAGWDYSGSLLP